MVFFGNRQVTGIPILKMGTPGVRQDWQVELSALSGDYLFPNERSAAVWKKAIFKLRSFP
jgi:hypothetical protein